MAKPATDRRTRCAIYTRKSSEEGLEQEFNSLDAQREACAAYILSQRHEGWTLIPDFYDDGGFSGGNLDRPGLRQLLADVASGKIDVIVVYKVDRLTRSLADFSKIVDVLEQGDASFVSVTQAFNTTTSMGRLMLNVLLSFAQFEREVTGERIRDKFAASKRKGMWMGGPVPLGYDLLDRKLVPNAAEAATVQLIFERYLALGSVRDLVDDLERRGIRSKERSYGNGRNCGGVPYRQGALAHMLRNPLYIGEVRHKGERFAGEHVGIIERGLWDEVQALLSGQAPARRKRDRSTEPSLLTGMIYDSKNRPMTPSHSVKGSRRYRYYITRIEERAGPDGWRLPVSVVDDAVLSGLRHWLCSSQAIVDTLLGGATNPGIIAEATTLGSNIETLPRDEQSALLRLMSANVTLQEDAIVIKLDRSALLAKLGCAPGDPDHVLTITIPAHLTRRGCEARLAYPADDDRAPAHIDLRLVKLLAEAEHAYVTRGDSTADRSKRDHRMRLARLKFLAPDIVSAILAGRQPASLNRQRLVRASFIPLEWQQQRRMFGFS